MMPNHRAPPFPRALFALLSVQVLASTGSTAPLCAQARPVPGEERFARIYELVGIVDSPHSRGPDLVLVDAGQEPPGPPPTRGPAAIAHLAAAFAQPALRADEEIQPLGERWLVVLGRAEQHAWVERFLADAKEQAAAALRVQCELFAMPELVFQRDVAPALRRDGGAGAETPAVLAPGERTRAFLESLARHGEVTAVELPGVVLRPLSPGHVSVANQTAYVRDFEVEVAQGSFVANPIVDVVKDGVSVVTSAVPLGDVTGLSLDVKVADLQRPIPTLETTLAGGTLPVTIQVPQLFETRVEATVKLPPEHTVVLTLPARTGRRYLVTVVAGPFDGKPPEPAVRDK